MTVVPNIKRPTRQTLLRVGACTWVVLISLGTLVNLAAVPDRAESPDPDVSDARLSVLEAQLAELRQQADQWEQRPAPLSEARFDSEQAAVGQRIASVEQALAERATGQDVVALREHIGQIEAQLRQELRTARAPAPSRRSPSAAPEPPELPFTVTGLELRGGERFISTVPKGASAGPASIRILHPGETEGGWRLDAIEGRTAVLRQGTHVRRVDVP